MLRGEAVCVKAKATGSVISILPQDGDFCSVLLSARPRFRRGFTSIQGCHSKLEKHAKELCSVPCDLKSGQGIKQSGSDVVQEFRKLRTLRVRVCQRVATLDAPRQVWQSQISLACMRSTFRRWTTGKRIPVWSSVRSAVMSRGPLSSAASWSGDVHR